jgi:CHAD domain-containing protein
MVHKRAVAKQQDTSRSQASAPPDPRAQLTATADAFNAAVAQAAQDADPQAVHATRTGSRRVQAMLEAILREHAALEQPAKAWLRQLKQARRAAGAVRDLDVHRKLLEDWTDKEAPEATPQRKQAETLDTWLKGERKHLAHGMQKQLRKRQQALAKRQAAFLDTAGSESLSSSRNPCAGDAVALEAFVRAADAMPRLDAENLHDFRKAIKKARYLAEAGCDPAADSSVAKALKRVQDAIGEWHDWQCLREEAKTALAEDAPELSAALDRELQRSFTAALKTTLTLRGQLSGEWMAISQLPAKRPPASVAVSDRRLASGNGPSRLKIM